MNIKDASKLVDRTFKTQCAMRFLHKNANDSADELLRIAIEDSGLGKQLDAIAICADFETGEFQAFIRMTDGRTFMEKEPRIGYVGFHLMRMLIINHEIEKGKMMRYIAKLINGGDDYRISIINDEDDEVGGNLIFCFPSNDMETEIKFSTPNFDAGAGWKQLMTELIL